MAENGFREIITKAVCGRGKKFSQSTHTVTPTHKPSNILGCWVINHKYHTSYQKDAVIVEGTYDINTWYSYNNNSKTEVVCETASYRDRVPLTLRDKKLISRVDLLCRTLQEPNCLEAKISSGGNKIEAQVEREFLVEVVGETKVRVRVDGDGLIAVDDEDEDEKEEQEQEDRTGDAKADSSDNDKETDNFDDEIGDLDSDFLTEEDE